MTLFSLLRASVGPERAALCHPCIIPSPHLDQAFSYLSSSTAFLHLTNVGSFQSSVKISSSQLPAPASRSLIESCYTVGHRLVDVFLKLPSAGRATWRMIALTIKLPRRTSHPPMKFRCFTTPLLKAKPDSYHPGHAAQGGATTMSI